MSGYFQGVTNNKFGYYQSLSQILSSIGGGGSGGDFGNIVNLKDAGAIGDGSADDTFSFKNVINHSDDSVIFLPPGIFNIHDELIFDRPVTLIGSGKHRTIVNISEQDMQGPNLAGNGITLINLQVRGTKRSFDGLIREDGLTGWSNIRIEGGTNIDLINCAFPDADESGVTVRYRYNDDKSGIIVAKNINIINCDFERFHRQGIEVFFAEDVNVFGGTISNPDDWVYRQRDLQQPSRGIRVGSPINLSVKGTRLYNLVSGVRAVRVQPGGTQLYQEPTNCVFEGLLVDGFEDQAFRLGIVKGITVKGNTIVNQKQDADVAAVEVEYEGKQEQTFITDNTLNNVEYAFGINGRMDTTIKNNKVHGVRKNSILHKGAYEGNAIISGNEFHQLGGVVAKTIDTENTDATVYFQDNYIKTPTGNYSFDVDIEYKTEKGGVESNEGMVQQYD